jgi:hypothetical protein
VWVGILLTEQTRPNNIVIVVLVWIPPVAMANNYLKNRRKRTAKLAGILSPLLEPGVRIAKQWYRA